MTPLNFPRSFKFSYPDRSSRNPGDSIRAPILVNCGFEKQTGTPSSSISPQSYGRSPQMHLKRTVLPEPFIPIKPSTYPQSKLRLMLFWFCFFTPEKNF